MRDAVVICTRDRPEDLSRCLASIHIQTVSPSRLFVVDASSDSRSEELASKFGAEHVRGAAGLTRQRNLAVERLVPDIDVVHFVDDDVVLDPGYVAGLRACFEDDEVVGAGGVITNAPAHRPYLLRRLFMLDSQRPGTVLRSGRAVLAFMPQGTLEVDWLSGCSMSYRTLVFDRLRFDAGLSGYSMGEDVDFSFRAGRIGKLVVTPKARLEHRCSQVNRIGIAEWYAMDVVTRHRRVLRSEGRLSRAAFWWSVGGEVVLAIGKAVVRRRRSALAAVRGTGRGIVALLHARLEDQVP